MKNVAWYYATGDRQQGPVAWEKLCAMAAAGELSSDDLVWSDGASDWYPAAQAEGLVFGGDVASQKSEKTDPTDATSADEEPSNDPPADDGMSDTGTSDTTPPPPPPQKTPQEPPIIEERGDLAGISFADSVRVAIDDGWTAFRILVVNPTGQLSEVHRQLGPKRAMMVGGAFAAVYFVCFVLGSGAMLGFFLSLTSGAFAPAVLLGGVWAARSIAHAKGEYQTDIFLAGCALLPLGFATLIGGILGSASLGLPILLGTFAICYAALILFRGFQSIYGLSEAAAMFAGPAVLATSLWIVSRVLTF